MQLIFLGTGAGVGVPAFFCNCTTCIEAKENPRCRRTRCAMLLSGKENLLIDAPPELSAQLLRENINRIDCLLITHAHPDHCAGLGDLEIYSRFFRKSRLPAIMSRETLVKLQSIYGDVQEWMAVELLEHGARMSRSAVSLTAFDVSHSPGTFGYMFSYKDSRIAYAPDTGPIPARSKKMLFNVDHLILDATFWDENWYPQDHLSFEEAIEVAHELNACTLYLTHLSMHYSKPVTSAEIQAHLESYLGRVRLAFDGMRVPISGG